MVTRQHSLQTGTTAFDGYGRPIQYIKPDRLATIRRESLEERLPLPRSAVYSPRQISMSIDWFEIAKSIICINLCSYFQPYIFPSNNCRFSSSPRFARKINKLSSTSSTTSDSSGRQPLYLDVEAPDHPTNLRKSSSGTSLSSQTSVSLSKPVRPESAGDKSNRRTQSSLVVNSDQSEAQLTRNQPHHRPRLDLHDTAHPRFISRYLSLLPCSRLSTVFFFALTLFLVLK